MSAFWLKVNFFPIQYPIVNFTKCPSTGLLLQGDKSVQLVVLCAEKPTVSLLKRVAAELPVQLKQISEEHQYTVAMEPEDSAVLVADDAITVKVFLTSPLLREPQQQGKLLIIYPPNRFVDQISDNPND